MKNILTVARFTFLQLLRNVPAMIFLLGLPLFIIPILGSVFSWIPSSEPYLKGAANAQSFFAIGMMVFFQLFAGTTVMSSVRAAFLTPCRWRMFALPCAPLAMVLGMLAASTVMSVVQGALLAALSWGLWGARFGSVGILLLVLLGVALVSQLIGVALLLLFRNVTTAYVLGWIVSYGSGVLGGIIFPLPADNPLFHFTMTYGTPFSLAQTALLDSSRGGPGGEIALCIGALFCVAAALAGVTALLGRRKLA